MAEKIPEKTSEQIAQKKTGLESPKAEVEKAKAAASNEDPNILAKGQPDPARDTVILQDKLSEDDLAFYAKWAELLDWMRAYASERDGVMFEKEADFTDYIYRMSRPYDLPTTIMSASLSDPDGKPVLLFNASPRHAVFKEVILHPFESHTYRTLRYYPPKEALAEGKRVFTQTMLSDLADELFEFSH